MKKIFMSIAAAALLSSCAAVSTPAGFGGIYTGVTSGQAVSGNAVGKKVGTSQAINVLGIVASGNAGIDAAAKKAGIRKISHVDKRQTSVLGIFSSYQTIVYGD